MEMKGPVYYTQFSSPIGLLGIFLSSQGVCGLSFGEEGFMSRFREVAAFFGHEPRPERERLKQVLQGLSGFLHGRSREISAPVFLFGLTPFQSRVLNILRNIPYGAVQSYQRVAEQAGNSMACRAVGSACAANPVPILIPCHRVVSKDGSLGGFSAGTGIKKWLLDLERSRPVRQT